MAGEHRAPASPARKAGQAVVVSICLFVIIILLSIAGMVIAASVMAVQNGPTP